MKARLEDNLQRQVASYLSAVAPDLLWSHFPAGEARTAITGAKLRSFGLKRGWPDMVLVLPGGQFAGIELKAEGGRQSPEQRAVEADLRMVGARYAVCRSVQDVRDTLAGWGVETRERA